jgi:hypothetical protein
VEKAGPAGATGPAGAARFKALVALAMGTDGLNLDPERAGKVAALVSEVGPGLKAAQKAVLDAMATPAEFADVVRKARRPYSLTVADQWFREAETAQRAALTVEAAEKQRMTASQKRSLLAAIEAARAAMRHEPFRSTLAALAARVKRMT